MKNTHLLSLACIMLISSPVFAKAPLSLFVDGEKAVEVDLQAPALQLESKMLQVAGAEKKMISHDSIGSDQIATLISFLNNNKHLVVKGEHKGEIGKLYFNPDFGGNHSGKIFFSNGSGAVRLQQSFYYRDKNNKTVHIPFEGAEAVVLIKENLEGGETLSGDITSINSSLINSKSYEEKVPLLKDLNDGSFKAVSDMSPEKRDQFVDQILAPNGVLDVWESVAEAVYPGEKFKERDQFVIKAKADKDIVQKVMLSQKSKSSLVFSSKDGQKSFDLVYSLKSPFGIPKNYKINIDSNSDEIFHEVENLDKHVVVNIYKGSMFKIKKTKKRSEESSVAKKMKIKEGFFRQVDYDIALINLSKVVEEFKGHFKWNGFDNKGSDLDATVRYKGSKLLGTDFLRQNAAWVGAPYNQFIFGRGGDELNNFLEAFDVIGHEYCHAVVAHTAGLKGGSEPGALNEHVCDILGVGVESTITGKPYDFRIGELVVQKGDNALRDFLTPDQSSSRQASSMADVESRFGIFCIPSQNNDECGVHYSNGVPNNAIGKSIRAIGWRRMKNVVFDTVTKRLRSTSDFSDYKRQILASCKDQGNISAAECKKVAGFFNEVGVK